MEIPKVKMMADRILVKQKESEEKTPGGIVLPDKVQKKLAEGKVIAIGPFTDRETWEDDPVSEGDHIKFVPYGGVEVKIEGEEFLVISISDVFLVLEQ